MSTRILSRRPDRQDPTTDRTASAIRPFVSTLLAVVGLHAVAAAALLDRGLSWSGLVTATITAASVAIGTAALVRQQDVVNAVFGGVTAAPHSWPLRVRAALAQVHQVLAGIHVGSAIAATGWFGAFTALVGWRVLTGGAAWTAVFGVAAAILVVLVIMTICAVPRMRERHHDLFEATHRFGGWLALALFAGLTVLFAVVTTRGPAGSWELTVADSPNTWILLLAAVAAILPWLQLRRAAVQVAAPSEHVALVTVNRGRSVRTGSASRIARRPLGQWHAFANMTVPGSTEYRMAVSRAGGWTSEFIADRPDHVWVKGVPTTGVGSVSRLFTRVVWVATGSGIAPCLPHLLGDPTPARLIWVTRNPERTYGRELVAQIMAAQPDALIWDTDADGKPDLAQLAARVCRETGAEAVVCISNKKATMRVVGRLRADGIAAYGPIWDS